MDPVDNNSLGVKALASVRIPVAITYSEPSSCDGLANQAEYALALDPLTPSAQLAPFVSKLRIGEEAFSAITFTRGTMATDFPSPWSSAPIYTSG